MEVNKIKLHAGIIINNRYSLERIIATGGMGEMWEAKDTLLGRKVAIKAIREENAGNDDMLNRLRIEARNNAVLTGHPNIVALLDYAENDGVGFIVMEYVDGKSMGEILLERPIMPLEELLPILSQIARALGFAHRNGIIHRDVKPGNILIDGKGHVKIVDFGVSKAVNQLNMTATGMVVGTAQYLSPEQAIGEDASGPSDIYALGIIAYEASQGRRPFGGRTSVDIAISQVNDPVPPMNPETNPQFVALVMNLLDKDATKRAVDGERVASSFDELSEEIAKEKNNILDILDATNKNAANVPGSIRQNQADFVPLISNSDIQRNKTSKHAASTHRKSATNPQLKFNKRPPSGVNVGVNNKHSNNYRTYQAMPKKRNMPQNTRVKQTANRRNYQKKRFDVAVSIAITMIICVSILIFLLLVAIFGG